MSNSEPVTGLQQHGSHGMEDTQPSGSGSPGAHPEQDEVAGGWVRDDGHEQAGRGNQQRVGHIQVSLVGLLERAAQAEDHPACTGGRPRGRVLSACKLSLVSLLLQRAVFAEDDPQPRAEPAGWQGHSQ